MHVENVGVCSLFRPNKWTARFVPRQRMSDWISVLEKFRRRESFAQVTIISCFTVSVGTFSTLVHICSDCLRNSWEGRAETPFVVAITWFNSLEQGKLTKAETKVKNDHRSKFSNLSNWKEEAWKNQGFNGIRTRDLRDTGAMLYQLSYEATHWERGQFIEFISSREEWEDVKFIWNNSYMNCDCRW